MPEIEYFYSGHTAETTLATNDWVVADADPLLVRSGFGYTRTILTTKLSACF